MKQKTSFQTQPAAKVQPRLSKYVIKAAIAVSFLFMIALGFYLSVGTSQESKAGTKRRFVISKASGNWASESTWSPGVPQNGDSVFVREGDKIIVSGKVALPDIQMSVSGVLRLAPQALLEMDNASVIYILAPKGILNASNPALASTTDPDSKIVVNHKEIWNSAMSALSENMMISSAGIYSYYRGNPNFFIFGPSSYTMMAKN
jgi:hypothetical protein